MPFQHSFGESFWVQMTNKNGMDVYSNQIHSIGRLQAGGTEIGMYNKTVEAMQGHGEDMKKLGRWCCVGCW